MHQTEIGIILCVGIMLYFEFFEKQVTFHAYMT